MERPDLLADPRFATSESRDEHNDVLLPVIADWVAAMPADVLVERLDSAGVAASRMHRIDEVMSHPQVLARGDFIDLEDPIFGTLPAYAPMPRLSGTPGRIDRPGPRLGEHNDEVYRGLLGFDDDRMKALAGSGAI
jgi:formyl-CoA transferase